MEYDTATYFTFLKFVVFVSFGGMLMLMRAVVILLAANLFQKIILTQNSKELTLFEELNKFRSKE